MTDPTAQSTVFGRCVEILSAQTTKGSAKYGGPLDVTRPSLIATLRHAQQEAADLLQYLVHAEREGLADPLTAAKAALDSAIAEVGKAPAPEPPSGRVWVRKGEAHKIGDTSILSGGVFCSVSTRLEFPCVEEFYWHRAAPAPESPAQEWEEFRGDRKRLTMVGDLVRHESEPKEVPWSVVACAAESLPGYIYRRGVSPAPAKWTPGLNALADCLMDSPMSPAPAQEATLPPGYAVVDLAEPSPPLTAEDVKRAYLLGRNDQAEGKTPRGTEYLRDLAALPKRDLAALRQRAEKAEARAKELEKLIGDLKVRIVFVGWPAEPMWEVRPGVFVPDWRNELRRIDHCLHGTPIPTEPESPSVPAHQTPERTSSRIAELESEVAERDATISAMYAADRRAVERWQTATGNTLVLPDQAQLVFWLLEQLDAAKAALASAKEADASAPFRPALEKLAAAIGITSPLQLTVSAKDDSENYADILARLVCERLASAKAAQEDGERLDWVENNLGALRSFGNPMGDTGDYSCHWEAVEYHMAEPRERVVGHGFEGQGGLRAAIDAARQAANAGGES